MTDADPISAPAGDRRWLRGSVAALFLVILAVLFTTFSLEQSRVVGRLSSIPNYDDVTYLNRASEIYYIGKDHGVRAALASIFSDELHSPFAVLNALLGHVLFGPNVDRIYYALTLVVLTYLTFVAVIARRLAWPLFAGIVVASLGLPFAGLAALEFRPDLMWATVLGGSSVLFLGATKPMTRWWTSAAYGVALGVVLVTKPSTFAMSFLVMGGCWFLVAVTGLVCRTTTWRQVGSSLGLVAAGMLVAGGWYFVAHLQDSIHYFYVNSFGENRDVWSYKGSLWDRLTFYVHGVALHSNLGYAVFLLVTVYLAGAIGDLAKGRTLAVRLRGFSFLWMIVCLFGVNAYFNMKSPFLGGSFYGFLIFGSIWYAALALESICREGWLATRGRQIVAALVVASIGCSAYAYPEASTVNVRMRPVKKSINRAICRDLLVQSRGKREVAVLFTQGNPVVWEYLQMEFRNRRRQLNANTAAFLRDPAAVIAMADSADFIVLQDQQLAGIPGDAIPVEECLPALVSHFSQAPDWELAGKYSDLNGKFAYLFKKKTPSP